MGPRTLFRLKRKPRPATCPYGRGANTAAGHKLYAAARAFFEKRLAEGDYSEQDRAFALTSHFLPDKREVYDFEAFAAEDFVTDVEHTAFWMAMSRDPYDVLLRNKLITAQMLAPHIRTPKVHAVYRGGKEVYFPAAEPDGACHLFVKPLALGKGKGAARIEAGTAAGAETVRRMAARYKDLIVTECLQQHRFMDGLFAGSVNTVRVVTLNLAGNLAGKLAGDPEADGAPHALAAIVRVGTGDSAPVDNVSSGGISFDLDVETGEIGPGGRDRYPTDKITAHPDTGAQISGLMLPGGNAVVRKCIELHSFLPFNRIVGWDICIAPEDFVLIEGNATPALDIHQMHRPLMTDRHLRALFHDLHIL